MTWLTAYLPWAVALALVALGVGALVAPGISSRQYGVPTDEPAALAFARAAGARDLVLGLIVAALAARGDSAGLRWAIGLGALMAVADFAIVGAHTQFRARRSLALHAMGALGMLIAAAMVAAAG